MSIPKITNIMPSGLNFLILVRLTKPARQWPTATKRWVEAHTARYSDAYGVLIGDADCL